jgi:polysaccharide biosynthesis protein PslH
MKKILFITEKFPYPLDSGGRIRTYNILKGLSQKYEINLVTAIEHDDQKTYIHELEKYCFRVDTVEVPADTKFSLGLKILNNIGSSIPIVVKRHHLHGIAAIVRARAAECDAVHFDHLDASIYMSDIPKNAKTVIDEHNIVSNQVRTSADCESNPLKKLYMRLQQKKTEQYEATVCEKVTRCFVCSDTDRTYLRNMATNANVETIPNGVDLNYFTDKSRRSHTSASGSETGQSIVFVGALDYGPGGAAVKFFCDDVLPLIHTVMPELNFIAVGQNPPSYLKDLGKRDFRINITGRVDDVRPYLAQSKVFVVPLRSGSGTRLKILSAMAMMIPVVSTTIGAEGLNISHGENILIADTPEKFSEAVIMLLRDRTLADSITRKARKLVEETYSWEVITDKLLSAYGNILCLSGRIGG